MKDAAPVLAFDIETIPDAVGARTVLELPDSVSDDDAAEMALRLRRQESGRGDAFLRLPLHRVAVISCALRVSDAADAEGGLKVFSLCEPRYDEKSAVAMFFKIIDKYTPQLVSWNGGGFDLPVLHYRAMAFGVAARRYWQADGTDARGDKFHYNRYTARYHDRHLDLMDVLAMHQPGAFARLDDMAKVCGLPGKIGVGGAGVWDAFREGRLDEVRQYCEADAMLTYLLYARFQRFRGAWSTEEYRAECAFARERLTAEGGHWCEFLEKWREES